MGRRHRDNRYRETVETYDWLGRRVYRSRWKEPWPWGTTLLLLFGMLVIGLRGCQP